MFKITKRDFNVPGNMYYVDITLHGERVPAKGPGLILQGDSEAYLQKVLGGILQDAFDRGREAGREDLRTERSRDMQDAFDRGEAKGRAAAAVREWNRGYERGVANIRREVEKALRSIPV